MSKQTFKRLGQSKTGTYRQYFDAKINHINNLQSKAIQKFQNQVKQLECTFMEFINHIQNVLIQRLTLIFDSYKKQYALKIKKVEQRFVSGKIQFFIAKYKRKYQKYLQNINNEDHNASIITKIINGALDEQFQASVNSINSFLSMSFPTAQFQANNSMISEFLSDIQYSQDKLVKIKGNYAYQMITTQIQADQSRKHQEQLTKIKTNNVKESKITQLIANNSMVKIQRKDQQNPFQAIQQFKRDKRQRQQAKIIKRVQQEIGKSPLVSPFASQVKTNFVSQVKASSKIQQLNKMKQKLLRNIK